MAIPDDFHRESLYTPDGWFIHDLLTVDREGGRIVASTDTNRLGPLVDAQLDRPGHPRHVPGAVVVQMTATLGQLYAIYVLGLRATEGWVGFGTHIHKAKFPKIGRIGPPVTSTARATKIRTVRGPTFIDYEFRFEQEGAVIYESVQTAAWLRSPPGPASPA